MGAGKILIDNTANRKSEISSVISAVIDGGRLLVQKRFDSGAGFNLHLAGFSEDWPRKHCLLSLNRHIVQRTLYLMMRPSVL